MKKKQKRIEKTDVINRFDKVVSIFNLLLALFSLICTIYIGIQANQIAGRNQNLDYKIKIDNNTIATSFLENDPDSLTYNMGNIILTNVKNKASGEYSDVFFAVVDNDVVELQYVPNDKGFSMSTKIFSNSTFFLVDNFSEKKKRVVVGFGAKTGTWKAFNRQVNAFHILFKAYNGTYSLFTIVYACVEKELDLESGLFGKPINFHILDDATIYDYYILWEIANELNSYNQAKEGDEIFFSSEKVLQTVKAQRDAIYKEIQNSNL